MEAFCGKWRLDRESCEGEREFYEAEGSMPDSDMIDKILEAECIVTMAEVGRSIKSHIIVMMQMEEEGKYDYKIEFVGLFVLDEDFVLGEEKTIAMPITGEEVNLTSKL